MSEGARRQTGCCIAGGGPAGMMLGFLLARAGVEVVVLEKHGDFLRDFRGDTIHPSTLQLMHELGLLEDFLRLPHEKAPKLRAHFGKLELVFADFSHLPVEAPYIAFMPQWDFLDFLADQGRRYPGFHLLLRAEVRDLVMEDGRVVGVKAETADGPLTIRADLVVGCDGRDSTLRERAELPVRDLGAPMDALWFRLPRKSSDPAETMGRFGAGHIAVMIQRGDYWQCAFVIPKGTADTLRDEGLEAFRRRVADSLAPFVGDRVQEIASWDDVKLLTVKVDRLERWHRPGLLCIGDAAHAMSPIGGVGINLAIQDAVAAANLLAEPLRRSRKGRPVDEADLHRVQRRRTLPTRLTQRLQLVLQKRVIERVLGSQQELEPPLLLRLVRRFPILSRIPARLVGLGFRPEHVQTPETAPLS